MRACPMELRDWIGLFDDGIIEIYRRRRIHTKWTTTSCDWMELALTS